MGTRGVKSLLLITCSSKKGDTKQYSTYIDLSNIESRGSNLRKAILVAMAEEEPFSRIKSEIYPRLTEYYSDHGYETFFVYGRKQKPWERNLRRKLEALRWNSFYPILRLYDFFALWIYKFSSPDCSLYEKNISVDVPEDIRHLSTKMLSALFLLNDLGYEIVIRTTVSSILLPEVIDITLAKADLTKAIYGGRINNQADGFTYTSGSLTVFNNKSIEILKSQKTKIDLSLIDDVAIGKFMIKQKILPSISFNFLDVKNENALVSFGTEKDIAQIRCKSEGRAEDRFDSALMKSAIEMLKI